MCRRLAAVAGAAHTALCVLAAPLPAGAQATWTVTDQPGLILGGRSDEADPDRVFHNVRGAVMTPEGWIAVADQSSYRVRVFADDGRPVHSFGGEGYGPTEFRGLGWVAECGSGLTVYDYSRHRVSHWTTGGQFVSGHPVQGVGERPPVELHCGPGGELAAVVWHDPAVVNDVGPHRPVNPVLLLDREGRVVREIGRFPGADRYRYPSNDGPQPLGRTLVALRGSDRVYVANGDTSVVRVYHDDGTTSTLGRAVPRRAVTPAILEPYKRLVVRMTPAEGRPAARRMLDAIEYPELLPGHGAVLLDRSGHLWIEEYAPPSDGPRPPSRWDVHHPEQGWVASVHLPPRFTPTDIGETYVLGVNRDDLDVERVERYGLRRGG